MEYIISVVSPDDVKELSKILKQMNVPIFLTVFAHGTAVQSMLDLLGIDSNERRIIIAVANSEKGASENKLKLRIDCSRRKLGQN